MSVFQQARPDFRDPLLVSLDFELTDKDRGPVLDESLPKSINKTVSAHILPALPGWQGCFGGVWEAEARQLTAVLHGPARAASGFPTLPQSGAQITAAPTVEARNRTVL